ncbi:MAG: HAMP domain-containing sensor histidine kinase [Leeuwenhoekiella sp.]
MKNAADFIMTNIPFLMSRWEEVVKEKVPASALTNSLILYDHLPSLLEDIADILIRTKDGDNLADDDRFIEIINNSVYHGRHRASTLEYTIEQVMHEYIIFHKVLTEELVEKEYFDDALANILKEIIEMAMLKSVESFSSAIQEMQEKLIGTLAHDIRNPLAAAKLSLEMMSQDTDAAKFARMRDITSRSLKKAINLIEGLMDAITVRAGEGITLNFEKLNVVQPVSWVCVEASEIYTQRIVFNCPKDPILGVFDEISIRRLLENLVTNAVKYGDGTSPITVKLVEHEAYVVLSVHNMGNPIPESKQESIFNFLAKNESDFSSYRNWGMGLALIKMVAEAHGGNIEVKSSTNEGTTFSATLFKESSAPGKKKTRLKDDAYKMVE